MQDYIHNVPGRIRLKTINLKKNPDSAEYLERRLTLMRGVKAASVNKLTGSIVINYDHKAIPPSHILNHLEKEGVYRPNATISQEQYVSNSMAKAGELAGKFIFGAAVEKALESVGISLFAALI